MDNNASSESIGSELVASPPRQDLLGLTCAAFTNWLRAQVGHDPALIRAQYRALFHEGRWLPGLVPAWSASFAQRPGLLASLTGLAHSDQVLPVLTTPQTPGETVEAVKILTQTHDGHRLESVLIPMGPDGARAQRTVCVSTQVGCRMGCVFCHTATMGLIRSLTTHEIIGQVIAVQRFTGIRPRNVVFMGMGEPLDNIEVVATAIQVLTDQAGLAIAPRHITISTVGRIDGLARWRDLGLQRVNLAISLTAADDAVRDALMPVNRVMPLARLREAVLALPLLPGRKILFAVVVIPGVTDQPDQIQRLIDWLNGLPAVVNVIPYNPIPSRNWRAPTDAEVRIMRDRLIAAGIPARLRATKGDRVMAACGQLGDPAQRRKPRQ